MEQWEYISTFLDAEASDEQTKNYIQQAFDKKPKRHSPEAMIPDLNRLGADGWELVHMEPVPRVGGKEDVQFDHYSWSNTYFCVFKRRVMQTVRVQAEAASEQPEQEKIPAPQLDPNMMAF